MEPQQSVEVEVILQEQVVMIGEALEMVNK